MPSNFFSSFFLQSGIFSSLFFSFQRNRGSRKGEERGSEEREGRENEYMHIDMYQKPQGGGGGSYPAAERRLDASQTDPFSQVRGIQKQQKKLWLFFHMSHSVTETHVTEKAGQPTWARGRTCTSVFLTSVEDSRAGAALGLYSSVSSGACHFHLFSASQGLSGNFLSIPYRHQ